MFGCHVNNYIAVAPEIGGSNSYSGYIADFLREAFSTSGRTYKCANDIIECVNTVLTEYGVIEGVADFKRRQEEKKYS